MENKNLSQLTQEDALYIASVVFTDSMPESRRIQIGIDFINYNFLGAGLHSSRSDILDEFDTLHIVEIVDYLRAKGYDIPNKTLTPKQ